MLNIKTRETETSITVTWEAVLNATGYDIEIDGQAVDNGNSLTYQHTGLQPNTNHTYRVRAKKSDVIEEWSEAITASTLLTGTIIITNKEELKQIANDLTATYVLGNNIDLENEKWEPIGSENVPFSGVFDGKGHKISNLSINKETQDYIGFFGKVSNGSVKDVAIENVNIKGRNNVGGLAGTTERECVIERCGIKGTGSIQGKGSVGGLIGYVNN
uniref:fibronectin type III domain-containing protein n=1 Tax=Anaerovorax odorimutans TaxID=109327 RepID=UPI0005646920